MKKQKFEFTKELFKGSELTSNEMLNVKGGGIRPGDIFMPTPPPIKI